MAKKLNQKSVSAAIKAFNKKKKDGNNCVCTNGKIGGKTCIACSGKGKK